MRTRSAAMSWRRRFGVPVAVFAVGVTAAVLTAPALAKSAIAHRSAPSDSASAASGHARASAAPGHTGRSPSNQRPANQSPSPTQTSTQTSSQTPSQTTPSPSPSQSPSETTQSPSPDQSVSQSPSHTQSPSPRQSVSPTAADSGRSGRRGGSAGPSGGSGQPQRSSRADGPDTGTSTAARPGTPARQDVTDRSAGHRCDSAHGVRRTTSGAGGCGTAVLDVAPAVTGTGRQVTGVPGTPPRPTPDGGDRVRPLGATPRAATGLPLPFTGTPTALLTVAALLPLAGGVAARRRSRPRHRGRHARLPSDRG